MNVINYKINKTTYHIHICSLQYDHDIVDKQRNHVHQIILSHNSPTCIMLHMHYYLRNNFKIPK